MRTVIAIAAVLSFCGTSAASVKSSNVEGYIVTYARHQAAHRGWTGYQWDALNTIVMRESTWNPCRHYPATTDCRYAGGNACGIPQRNPCPQAWRGRLWATWRAQVRELMRYVASRYGTPARALEVWNWQRSY